MNNVILSGIDHEGQIFVHYETHGGGMGAGPQRCRNIWRA